jgi:uncharacterized protein (TIGR02444 family)
MAAAPQKSAQPASREALDLDNTLWRFVLPFYARDGVAPACLTLQEQLGVDVNILLFAIFAQVERGVTLDQSDLASVDALMRDWRGEVIQPLRRVRTRMKSGPSPAPSAATESLRNRIKAAELEAERIALAVLFAWLDARPPRPPNPTAAKEIPLMIARYFQPNASAISADIETALEMLSQAIRDASAAKTAQGS